MVSDKSEQDQGEKQDLNPDSTDSILSDVDALLAEEDPEFFEKVKSISIDDSQVISTDIEAAAIDIETHVKEDYRVYLRRPFDFKNNTRSVSIFWGFIFIALILLTFTWYNNRALLSEKLFITSLEHLGEKTNSFNPNTDLEAFYDNSRFAKNLISMSPVHLNLKPSESSGENPMLAFEVTVEGLSTDAIIEIKDRQAEFKDMLARLTEEKTYDEMVTAEGKRQLCDQFRDLLNANLTKGQVRRVLIKNFIIKP